jgi:hypothetical protein
MNIGSSVQSLMGTREKMKSEYMIKKTGVIFDRHVNVLYV